MEQGVIKLLPMKMQYIYTVEPLIATPPSSGNLRIAYTILGTDLHRHYTVSWRPPRSTNPPIPNSDPTLARQAHSFNTFYLQ